MKKSIFFAAALVAMVACNKTESSVNVTNSEEIGFYSMSQNATRGYVVYSRFEEIVNPDTLKTNSSEGVSTDKKDREMIVNAFNITDSTDYFKAPITFKAPTTGTKIWRATPAQYWPIGKDLKFLSYSSNNITVSGKKRDEIKANWENAKKVTFNVTPEQCYQNDILYAQAKGNNRGTSTAKDGSSHDAGLPVTFYHAQAWLTFNITVTGVDTSAVHVAVDKIVLKDVYNSGVLSFEYDETSAKTTPKPVAKWDFFTQNPTDVEVDDPWGVLKATNFLKGNDRSANPKHYNGVQLNMLMPEQKHNDFVLYYTMNKQQNSIKLPFNDGAFDGTQKVSDGSTISELSGKSQEWVMGYHYIYNITLSINEITFAPSVNVWTEVKGFTEDQAL